MGRIGQVRLLDFEPNGTLAVGNDIKHIDGLGNAPLCCEKCRNMGNRKTNQKARNDVTVSRARLQGFYISS